MVNSFIKEKLDAFLKPFFIDKEKQVGVEFEFAIINLDKKPIDISLIHKLNKFIVKFMDFSIAKTNTFDKTAISFKSNKSEDLLTYECSLNTLEFSMEQNRSIVEVSKRFYIYFEKIQEFLLQNNHILTGLGIHPFFDIIDTKPLNSDYYIQMYKYLARAENYSNLHPYIDFCSFTCSSQTQLDVAPEKIPETLSFLNKVNWISALLFSNSAKLTNNSNNIPNNYCTRDYFLDFSYFGINSNYIGVDDKPYNNIEDVYESLAKVPMNYAKRNGHFYFFEPIPFQDYFLKDKITLFKNSSDNNTISIIPEHSDLEYFRPKKNFSLTKKGTIEIRQDCQQKPEESFSIAAFYTGILEVMPQVKRLLEKYNYKNSEIRDKTINGIFDYFDDKKEVSELILTILDLINEALINREFGEEIFIKSLFKRAENLCPPAKENLQKLEEGEDIISIIKYNSK